MVEMSIADELGDWKEIGHETAALSQGQFSLIGACGVLLTSKSRVDIPRHSAATHILMTNHLQKRAISLSIFRFH